MIEIAHEGRAGQAADHLLGGAAHIDVDDAGTGGLGDAGRLPHPARFAPGELHGHGFFRRLPAGAQNHVFLFTDQILGRDHLGDDEAAALGADGPAERQVGDAGHGSKKNRLDMDVRAAPADAHRIAPHLTARPVCGGGVIGGGGRGWGPARYLLSWCAHILAAYLLIKLHRCAGRDKR